MTRKICLFLFLHSWLAALTTQTTGESIDSCEINSLYRELNCKPIFEKDSKCPVEYNCDDFTKSNPEVCYYNGKSYPKGDELKEEERTEVCHFHCRCVDSYPNRKHATWTCAAGECPGDRYKTGCVNVYDNLKSCCRNGTYCENTDPKPSLTCSYKGTTYVAGQFIYDEEKCKRCFCDSNFKDTLEGPSCLDQACGITLNSYLRDGCVPVYYGGSHCTCPIEHKCPDSTDAVIPGQKDLNTVPQSRSNCKFGNLSLKVGDKLVKKEKEQFECSCEIPPFVTCIQKPHDMTEKQVKTEEKV